MQLTHDKKNLGSLASCEVLLLGIIRRTLMNFKTSLNSNCAKIINNSVNIGQINFILSPEIINYQVDQAVVLLLELMHFQRSDDQLKLNLQ